MSNNAIKTEDERTPIFVSFLNLQIQNGEGCFSQFCLFLRFLITTYFGLRHEALRQCARHQILKH